MISHTGIRSQPQPVIVARSIADDIQLDAAHPAREWERAVAVRFCSDWQGKNPDPERETEVRLLWSPRRLYLRCECRYRELFVFENADPDGRRNQLWDRDVAEAFVQPDPSRERYYREFEVSPNGMWIDLDIFPGGRRDLKSGMERSVALDEHLRIWRAELAIPMTSLTPSFEPTKTWRANFYRIEGSKPARAYLAWQPTHTSQPNFHVPSAFGYLQFGGGGEG